MDLSQFSNWFIHQILPSDVKWWREMIDFLVSLHLLINIIFDWTNIPNYCRLSLDFFLRSDCCRLSFSNLLFGRHFSKPIIFKSVPYYLDIAISHIKIVAPVWWLIRSDLNWIFINSKDQIFFTNFMVHFDCWLLFKKHGWKLSSGWSRLFGQDNLFFLRILKILLS